MRREKQTIMTKGHPIRLLVAFALPLTIGNVFQQLYTVVDTMVVGKGLGVDALAALGATDWLSWMNIGMVSGLAQGFSILLAQEFGARNRERQRKVFGNSVLLAAVCAALLMIVFQAATVPVLRLLRTPEEILPMSVLYVRILFAGIPVTMAFNLLAAALRAFGDGRTPLVAMGLASCLNIGLDLLFVLSLGFGIAGAAAATLAAQMAAVLYCGRELLRQEGLMPGRGDFCPEAGLCGRLLRLSLPLALQNGIIAVGGMIVQLVVNGFGVVFLAGYTATNKLYGILELAATSYGYAVTTYVGQNVGAGRMDRVRSGHKAALALAVGTSVVISAVMLVFGRSILGLFLSGEPWEVEEAGNTAFRYLKLMSLALPSLYLLYVYRSCLQGIGNTWIPLLSGIVEFLLRTGIVVALTGKIGGDGVFYAEISAWIGAALLLAVGYYAVIVWKKRRDDEKTAGLSERV